MERNELCELLDKGYDGRQLTSLYTDRIDSIVKDVFNSATRSRPEASKICLIAVGGYGRGELAPFSDVDIMLFARDRSASEEARELLYCLWNTNLNISHSFRTPDDCITEAKKDVRTRTSLLEHRHIAGDTALYHYFRESVYPEVAFRNQKNYVTEKLREVEDRYRKFGDSVFMLEPNVKEGKGGLRDAHAVFWLASVAFRIRHFDELTSILTSYDVHRLRKAYDFLLKVRFCLHLLSGRKNETLSFEFHEPVAEMLRFKASRRFFASERFMRYLYLKTSLIHDIASYALDICSLPYVHLPLSVTKKAVTPDFSISKDRIVSTRDISTNTDALMEAFSVMSKAGKRLSPRLRADIKKNLFRITRKARNSPKAIERFMDIIRGNRVYETLNEMHRCGVLARFIPEFGALSFLVVYEPYHRYTVDEHSLRAVKRLEQLGGTKYKNLEHLSAVYRKIRHKEALFLSLLLHDIGKRGITRDSRFPDDDAERFHEGEGYMEMKNIMERFNIDIKMRNRIEFLVKNHTLISTVAFKRETEDPEVIAQLADEVADRENLDSLYLLTYADMAAVSPDFWTDWKGYLLRELYETASRYLEGFSEKGHEHISRMLSLSDKDKEEVRRFLSIMPERYLLSTPPEKIFADYRLSREVTGRNFGLKVDETAGGTAEITVGAWDSPGLFSKIVGVLSSMDMSIYRARVYTGTNGLVIDRVHISNWEELWWEGIAERLEGNLRGALVEGRAAKIRGGRGMRTESAGIPGFYGRYVPFVELDNETSGECSILEFFAGDRLGLLYDATSLMHDMGIDIISARINTESGLAHDIFSIQKDGGKMEGEGVTELLMALWERLR
ncbi:MAG: [protein-PII] uridylyltransferase [Nitrospirae bacterium]|nr:[protein-PII] uridylyltransferase [Nitrospirota bacterium]MCL5421789.1 [protein-PII] uridylyltransferase [Nitrospirota bacterium]